MFHLKRVYAAPSPNDGFRILVDRLWPRGLRKEAAKLDLWLKDIAPSPELRTWFGHDPAKFAEFAKAYRAQLDANPAVEQLRQLGKEHSPITLLYAARDEQANHAVVLAEYLADSQ